MTCESLQLVDLFQNELLKKKALYLERVECLQLFTKNLEHWNWFKQKYGESIYVNTARMEKRKEEIEEKLVELNRQLEEIPLLKRKENPHLDVIVDWLKDHYNFFWSNVPLHVSDKKNLKARIITEVQKIYPTKFKRVQELRLLDEMLDLFEVRYDEYIKNEETVKKRLQLRDEEFKLASRLKADLLSEYSFLTRELEKEERIRNSLADDLIRYIQK